MRVQDVFTRVASLDGSAAKHAEKAAPAAAVAAPEALKVTLSARAQELAARAPRVDALREAVRSGTFSVDAHAIVAKLVGGDE